MTIFWLAAAVMAIIAAGFVLLPLWLPALAGADRTKINVALYKEKRQALEEQLRRGEIDGTLFQTLDEEAQRDLLKDAEQSEAALPTSSKTSHLPLLLVALATPCLALVIYADWGFSRGAITDHALATSLKTTPPDAPSYKQLVRTLAARVADMPNPTDGNFLLASAYIHLGEHERAAAIYAELTQTFPNDPSLAALYAETLFIAEGKRLTPAVKAALSKVIELNPQQIKATEASKEE